MPLFYKQHQRNHRANTQAIPPLSSLRPGEQGHTHPLKMLTVEEALRGGKVGNALDQIGQTMRSFDVRHRKKLNEGLVTIYALAEHLRDNEDARMDFCQDPAWNTTLRNRPRLEKPALMLKHALRRANGLTEKSGSKRASKQFRALNPFFEAAVPYTQIGEKIKRNGGIGELAKAHATPRKQMHPNAELLRLILNQKLCPQTITNEYLGKELLIKIKLLEIKGGIVHGDVIRWGRSKS